MIEKVIEIVKDASIIMLDNNFDVVEKSGVENIVTSNDVRVQKYLIEKLKELLPDSGFLVEEENDNDITKDYIWVIDPIDGTTNYSRNIPVCAICVGLKYKEEMVLGVVYNPFAHKLYHAVKGEGSYLNGQRIHVKERPFNESIFYSSFDAYHKNRSHVMFNFLNNIFPYVNDIRRTGSAALEICEVAEGLGDLYLEYQLYPWDIAAASLILTEAGGYMCSLDINHLPLDRPTLGMCAASQENLKKLNDFALKSLG